MLDTRPNIIIIIYIIIIYINIYIYILLYYYYLLFRFNKKINYLIEMKGNFDWSPVTQADNAWLEYAMGRTYKYVFFLIKYSII